MKSFIYLILLVLLVSCTVEKRLYRPGYHVSSRSKIKVNNSNQNQKTAVLSHKTNNPKIDYKADEGTLLKEKHKLDEDSVINNNEVSSLRVPADVFSNAQATCKKRKKEKPLKKKYNSNITEKAEVQHEKTSLFEEKNKLSKNKIQEIKPNPNNEDKVINKAGVLSLIFAALALFLLFPSLLALILGVIGMKQAKKNPDKYKYTWMAIVSFVIGILGTSFIALFLVYLALLEASILFFVLAVLCGLLLLISLFIAFS